MIGQTITNGTDASGLHAPTMPWGATLTIVRATTGYGVTRYVVRDSYGRNGYAY